MITIDETNIECSEISNQFQLLKPSKRPKVIAGYKISTLYDFSRLRIKPTQKPVRYRFLSKTFDDVNEWYFVYGVEIPIVTKIQKMFHNSINMNLNIDTYFDFIENHGYTCEDNFLLVRKNVYLLDIKYIDEVSDGQFSNYNELSQIVETGSKFYQTCDEIKIFIIL